MSVQAVKTTQITNPISILKTQSKFSDQIHIWGKKTSANSTFSKSGNAIQIPLRFAKHLQEIRINKGNFLS